MEETAERHVRPALRQAFVDLCRGSVGAYLERFGFRSNLLKAMYAVRAPLRTWLGCWDVQAGVHWTCTCWLFGRVLPYPSGLTPLHQTPAPPGLNRLQTGSAGSTAAGTQRAAGTTCWCTTCAVCQAPRERGWLWPEAWER